MIIFKLSRQTKKATVNTAMVGNLVTKVNKKKDGPYGVGTSVR